MCGLQREAEKNLVSILALTISGELCHLTCLQIGRHVVNEVLHDYLLPRKKNEASSNNIKRDIVTFTSNEFLQAIHNVSSMPSGKRNILTLGSPTLLKENKN